MGIARLKKVTLLVPRGELDSVLRSLAEFEWFHPSQPESANPDPVIDELNSKSYKLFAELEELTQQLNIQIEPATADVLRKGFKVKKEELSAEDWADFVAQVEAEANPVIRELRELIDESNVVKKKLSDDEALKAALRMLSRFSVDLEQISGLRRLHMVFAICTTRDLAEIARSLPEQILLYTALTKADSALLLAGSRTDAERIDKVLRSFEVKPFLIPGDLPQNPAEAYNVVDKRLTDLQAKSIELGERLTKLSQSVQRKLLVLRESAHTAYTVLNQMRRSGDLKRFALVQGFIPEESEDEFNERCRDWIRFTEEIEEHGGEAPTLFKNRGLSKSFQVITLTQGPPRYGEVDPTPIISLIFPIFYGMMFGDLGQGLILLFLGVMLRIRGTPNLKYWGTVLMSVGFAATVMGALVGEAFGLELGATPGVGAFFHKIQILKVAEHGQFDQGVVAILLAASIMFGVAHITIGLIFDLIKGFREKNRVELYTLKIPSFIMYVFGVAFTLAFIGANYSFDDVWTSSGRTPVISDMIGQSVPASAVATFAMPLVIAAVLVIIVGKPVAGLMGKTHEEEKENIFLSLIFGIVEFLLRLVEFLANTISYARLGILLLVHIALMYAVVMTLQLGAMGLPLFIIGNLGVTALEGLIVYIQDIRLHLYEWFTKFYEGSGSLFSKMTPDTTYIQIKWRKPS